MKVPIHYYIDIATLTIADIQDYFVARQCYVKNQGGKTYLVEVLA